MSQRRAHSRALKWFGYQTEASASSFGGMYIAPRGSVKNLIWIAKENLFFFFFLKNWSSFYGKYFTPECVEYNKLYYYYKLYNELTRQQDFIPMVNMFKVVGTSLVKLKSVISTYLYNQCCRLYNSDLNFEIVKPKPKYEENLSKSGAIEYSSIQSAI